MAVRVDAGAVAALSSIAACRSNVSSMKALRRACVTMLMPGMLSASLRCMANAGCVTFTATSPGTTIVKGRKPALLESFASAVELRLACRVPEVLTVLCMRTRTGTLLLAGSEGHSHRYPNRLAPHVAPAALAEKWSTLLDH